MYVFQIQNYSFLSYIQLYLVFRHMFDLPFSGNVHIYSPVELFNLTIYNASM